STRPNPEASTSMAGRTVPRPAGACEQALVRPAGARYRELAAMIEPLEDRNVSAVQPLVPPRAVKAKLPVGAPERELVRATRAAIRDVLHGRDRHRLVVVVGPCSIHDPEAALDYARRLAAVAEATRESLVVVMRTYFEKPRTTVGWKGLINDPHLDGSCAIAEGLELARRGLVD